MDDLLGETGGRRRFMRPRPQDIMSIIPDRKWTYNSGEPVNNGTPGTTTITEREILEQFFEYWKSRMTQAGHEDLISEERCIEDWVVINWAWEEGTKPK